MASTTAAAAAATEAPATQPKFKFGVCQILVGEDKAKNLAAATTAIATAVGKGAQVVSLPECFNSPYGTGFFPKYCEEIPASADGIDEKQHPSTHMLVATAKKHGIYLIGGSIPELDSASGKIYNTTIIVGPDGTLLGRHRKMHLFDIDVPGKITFKESDTLTAGDDVTVVETPFGNIGVAICYDMRFPLLAALMRKRGANVLVYPGAFNTTTGPAHWELLIRARALDNQVYVAGVSPARNPDSDYPVWGHSTVVDPWGTVVATTEENEDVFVVDMDLEHEATVRSQVPVGFQARDDVYKLSTK